MYEQRIALLVEGYTRCNWITKSESPPPGAEFTQNKRNGGLEGETYWFNVAVGV